MPNTFDETTFNSFCNNGHLSLQMTQQHATLILLIIFKIYLSSSISFQIQPFYGTVNKDYTLLNKVFKYESYPTSAEKLLKHFLRFVG